MDVKILWKREYMIEDIKPRLKKKGYRIEVISRK